MRSPEPESSKLPRLLGILIGIPLVVVILLMVLRIWIFTTTYNGSSYREFPAVNAASLFVIALCIRGALSPNKRSWPVTVLVFVVLLVVGLIQEYIFARHMALFTGFDPASAPLIPTPTQFFAVMADQSSALGYMLLGIIGGTVLVGWLKDFSPGVRRYP